jgi:hypothetical protein
MHDPTPSSPHVFCWGVDLAQLNSRLRMAAAQATPVHAINAPTLDLETDLETLLH